MSHVDLASLPGEILLYILSFLEPIDITKLQLVSRLFRSIARDDGFWRARCLEESSFLENLNYRRQLLAPVHTIQNETIWQATFSMNGNGVDGGTLGTVLKTRPADLRERERVRVLANWDPSYSSEKVNWYEEYIQRHAPVAVNWLQHPQQRDGAERTLVEARGVALYRPDNPHVDPYRPEALFAVSPLDDGSVCLWDVNGARGRKGAIYAKSRPGILFIDGPGADNSRRSKRIDSGVTECVSVDSTLHRAFFAVQSHLIEVDLQRLCVVGCESYPWSITSMSAAHASVPLTVGTSLGIHLHDYRTRIGSKSTVVDSIDDFDRFGAKEFYERSLLKALYEDEPLPPYASLSQPGPLSILHLQQPGTGTGLSDDIYVAGRFSNILHYDRRRFPSIMGSIYSGARLSSMTSLPFPFSTLDSELRRVGELSIDQVEKSKSFPGGRTLIACGEYNTKGSLELYGLNNSSTSQSRSALSLPGALQNSTYKNRHCSESKLLSVATHGTRLVVSDGSGQLKWFERDGFTEVRRARLGHCEREQGPSLFSSMPGSDDIARKLLPTGRGQDSDGVNNNDLLFWTGEYLGLVGFSSKPGFTSDEFEENGKTATELENEKEERVYGEKMREALKRQADEVRFVRKLGMRA
ncbi:F-box only protein 31-B [Pleurostoma richardsiae]|uniref:F-box only protein 31-B n=1 Tax=Pleurostoma richardsiae TaxID=41990 RepID=A0AA38RPN9_9PEZI|nr:F-box only protein 31-B [Pleurostoma richardsiae]